MNLRSKFLLSLAVLTTALTTAALLVVRHSVLVHARQEITVSLQNAVGSVQDFQQRQAATAERSAQLLANLPVVKAMMTTGDPATIRDASGEVWSTAGTSLLALADASGRLMVVHTRNHLLGLQQAEALMTSSLRSLHRRDWWFSDGHLYEIFLQPIESGYQGQEKPLGTLAIGYEVDDSLARQIARFAEGEVLFRFNEQIIAKTLSPERLDDFAPLATMKLPATGELQMGGEHFFATSVTMGLPRSGAEVIVLKSYDQATSFLSNINRLVILVGLVTIVLGAGLVFVISHRFTKPLTQLVYGVRALGKGDFTYPLKASGNDEVAELTFAFDRMRHSLQESQGRMVASARREAIGQLAGGVAHDFNNLITIIKGYADLLISASQGNKASSEYAEQIKKAGDRAAGVTRQLLAFSRKQAAQAEILDLNPVVANMNKMLRVLIGEDIEVVHNGGTGLRKIFADVGQIEQILLNLVVNARDAMPEGGKIIIQTSNADVSEAGGPDFGADALPGSYARLSVSDTGCGISPDVLERIFEPFFTTKETGKGTGLGLAIVFGIVKHLHGFVRVKSEVGQGSRFDIYIPEAEKTDVTEAKKEVAAAAEAGSGTILVVEDEDGVRALLRESLRLRGYTVLEARDGVDALSVFEANRQAIQLVVTDVVMPRSGGVELAQRLLQLQPDMKILLISGYTDRIGEIEKIGLPLLAKPFTPDSLARRVREILLGQASRAVSRLAGSTGVH